VGGASPKIRLEELEIGPKQQLHFRAGSSFSNGVPGGTSSN
jgi:hypothetical protein